MIELITRDKWKYWIILNNNHLKYTYKIITRHLYTLES